jgi:hypothetical protein
MNPELSGDLDRAITQLYSTFSRYSADQLSGCPHCVADTDSRRLATTSLKSLSPNDLAHYSFKAMTTWGSEDDFKHFLPRLFEIVAREGEDFTDAEIVLAKLAYGKWRSWPRDEQAAIEDFFHALWLDVLSRHPHPLSADSCLCAIAGSVQDMSFYLDAWSAATPLPAMMHLAEFVVGNASGLAGTKSGVRLANAFWSDRPVQAKQVWDWLRAPARAEQLERAFFDFGSNDEQGALSEAFIYLDSLRQRSEGSA